MTIRAYETYCENIDKVDGSYTVKEFLTDIENGDWYQFKKHNIFRSFKNRFYIKGENK